LNYILNKDHDLLDLVKASRLVEYILDIYLQKFIEVDVKDSIHTVTYVTVFHKSRVHLRRRDGD
jgi:hypothetical protein